LSIAFKQNPRLKRIESRAFNGLSCTIVIPCTVLFVASGLGVHRPQLLFAEGHSCEEFDGWLWIRKSGIAVDFRRILRFGSCFLEFRSYLFEDSVIEEMAMIYESAGIDHNFSRGFEDDL
jgi:hypothetical protein